MTSERMQRLQRFSEIKKSTPDTTNTVLYHTKMISLEKEIGSIDHELTMITRKHLPGLGNQDYSEQLSNLTTRKDKLLRDKALLMELRNGPPG